MGDNISANFHERTLLMNINIGSINLRVKDHQRHTLAVYIDKCFNSPGVYNDS